MPTANPSNVYALLWSWTVDLMLPQELTAKTHLAGLVQAAETGEVVHISTHGKPVAVLISEQAYASLQGHQSRRGV